MEITLLIKSVMGLVVVLAFLMFLLFYKPFKKKEKLVTKVSSTPLPSVDTLDLKSLVAIVKNKKSSPEALKEVLDLIIKKYGKIHPKLGIRIHPDFDIYEEILFRICIHKNTNKRLILDFEKELKKLNPEYLKEINNATSRGLNSRRV